LEVITKKSKKWPMVIDEKLVVWVSKFEPELLSIEGYEVDQSNATVLGIPQLCLSM